MLVQDGGAGGGDGGDESSNTGSALLRNLIFLKYLLYVTNKNLTNVDQFFCLVFLFSIVLVSVYLTCLYLLSCIVV